MRRVLIPAAVIFGLLPAGASVATARTTTLSANADTYLLKSSPNTNRGGKEELKLSADNKTRVLVRFDQAAIAGAVGSGRLVSATLGLFVEETNRKFGPNGKTVAAHRVTAAWTELGATWNCPSDTKPRDDRADCPVQWNGGAFITTPTKTVVYTNATRGWVDFDVTVDVAAFLAGTADSGWLVRQTESGGDATAAHRSREAEGDEDDRAHRRDGGGHGDDGGHGHGEGSGPRLVLVVETAVDSTPPTLTFSEPLVPVLIDQPAPQVKLNFADAGSGIAPASFHLGLEGVDITEGCTLAAGGATCQMPTLSTAANGASQHRLNAEVRDRSGNRATASLTLLLVMGQGDVTPPRVVIVAPANGALVAAQPIQVSGLVLDDGVIQRLAVGGTEVTPGASFAQSVPLREGRNTIEVRALDGAGHFASAEVEVFLDTTAPTLAVQAPADGITTNGDAVVVTGRVADKSGAVAVTVNGVPATVTDGQFQAAVPLAPGANALVVRAVDPAGNATTRMVTVNRFRVPRPVIDGPADLSITGSATITVTGTIDDPTAAVTVEGVLATVSAGRFTATGVTVRPGPTLITARATGATDAVGTATITVIRDVLLPYLSVYSPAPGAVVRDTAIPVHGFVSDSSEGALNPPPVMVTVNGLAAAVSKDTYLAPAVPLTPGTNTLTIEATDASGNRRTLTVPVTYDAAPARRLRIVSGDFQSATIGAALPLPFVVQLLDLTGLPVTGKPVLFSLKGNDGALGAGGGGGRRQVAVTTDANGQAAVDFTLGTRAGAGNQVVEAFVAGFGPPVAFHASGLAGPPTLLIPDAGDEQLGATGQRLPFPLSAVATDAGFNRLPGLAVRFLVVKGGGTFDDGTTDKEVSTDRFGRALVGFRLGAEEGTANNAVEATIQGVAGPFAGFVASGQTAGPAAATTISGVALDNSNQPVPGVTLRLRGTVMTAVSDAQGTFRIANAPVGPQFLIVDGSTVTRPGVWPDLEFDLNVVPGRDNTIGMPIFLLPIDAGRGIQVSETQGGTITLAEWPGFALTIEPGSVTFPGGSKSGSVSVTQVHADKIPMVPNFGQQPRFIVSIQPAGARFDPPARMSLPNLDGLPPGAVTEMYSFDHDLGRFVSIGPATVSDDGTTVRSNFGVGVVKAGWHCGGNPSGSGTPHDCPVCNTCVNEQCAPDDGQAPQQTAPDDCLRQICYAGSVRSVPDINEIPLDLVGNCADGVCTGAGPDLRTNLSDAPPGMRCCDTGSGSGGTPFDPQQQCCEAPKLLTKYPMPSIAECPDRTARPGHVPGQGHTLGCGPEAADWTVPDNPNINPQLLCFGPSFFSACLGHDLCYDTCLSPGKDACDSNFLAAMQALCAGASLQCRLACLGNAQAYYAAVHFFGGGPFESGQQHACQCCP